MIEAQGEHAGLGPHFERPEYGCPAQGGIVRVENDHVRPQGVEALHRVRIAGHLFLFGRWQSPIVWDIIAISTYLTGSFIYLYLPLIPDFALASARIGHLVSGPKRLMFSVLSLG